MILEIIDDSGFMPEGGSELVEQVAACCLSEEGIQNACASLTLVSGEEIRQLNARARGVDRETDVLSFPETRWPSPKTAKDCPNLLKKAYDPALGAPFLGDIVLNVSRAREQAEELGHSLRREMGYLTAHAMFHLMGYDHMTDEDKPVMREMEKRAMRRLKLYRNEDPDNGKD